uniref:Uncharacterized protein n=1 Tax=Pithovirus LCPAC101 TaxID=2506586 RepID=A0A481Z2P2_9VIRU|nr:MAG: hypothetical protein LCPAC101_02760 [Pithovirus LCPAC101]
MSYHEIKLDTFKEYFNKELKLYDNFGDIRKSWNADSIPGVQNMSPELMVLTFAYLTNFGLITPEIYNKAAKLFDESSEINQISEDEIENVINDINEEMEKKKFDNDIDLDIAISIYTSNIDDSIISGILKNREGDKVPELNNWPFKGGKIQNTKIKLKMELAAYITNILKTYSI